jgi:NAD-dependent SIR2 family protein deacetylase
LLLRCYTQNIDGLEELAGLPPSLVVCAHGGLDPCHCQDCQLEIPLSHCIEAIAANHPDADDYIGTAVPLCPACDGAFVKPDVVFFGERLPQRFYDALRGDLAKCDLLLVAGTSLEVFPFAAIADAVPAPVPRFVMNRENVLDRRGALRRLWRFVRGLIGVPEAADQRDWFIGGDVQAAAAAVAEGLGWELPGAVDCE